MTESTDSLKSEEQLQEMIAETETGARNPTGTIPKKILFYVPLIWTLFQLWYASPLPFIFNIFVLNDTEARAIHLAFAVFLSFTAYPTHIRMEFISKPDYTEIVSKSNPLVYFVRCCKNNIRTDIRLGNF